MADADADAGAACVGAGARTQTPGSACQGLSSARTAAVPGRGAVAAVGFGVVGAYVVVEKVGVIAREQPEAPAGERMKMRDY